MTSSPSTSEISDTQSKEVHLYGDPRTVEIAVASKEYKCCFCQRHEVNSTEWGDLLKLGEIVTHHFCLLFSSLAKQLGDDNEGIHAFMPAEIRKEVNRGKRLKCKYCKQPYATIGCGVTKCSASFHYSCGYEVGCLFQFYGQFQAYCPRHKHKQKIPTTICRECPICMVDVDKDEGVWPPCCGKRLFHRRCLLYTAKAAGYFFKCPLCNSNSPKFIHAMKANGVYVPQQDAAWELEPNAFQELLVNYSRCDAKFCVCPDGREFFAKTGTNAKNWCLIRCSTCGSSATHAKCSGLDTGKWKCQGCRAVFRKSGAKDAGLSSVSDSDAESNTSDSSDETSSEEGLLAVLPRVSSVIRSCRLASGYHQSQIDKILAEADADMTVEKLSAPLSPPPEDDQDGVDDSMTFDSNSGNAEGPGGEYPASGARVRRAVVSFDPASAGNFIIQLQLRKQFAPLYDAKNPEFNQEKTIGERRRLARLQSFFHSKSFARKEARAEARSVQNNTRNNEDQEVEERSRITHTLDQIDYVNENETDMQEEEDINESEQDESQWNSSQIGKEGREKSVQNEPPTVFRNFVSYVPHDKYIVEYNTERDQSNAESMNLKTLKRRRFQPSDIAKQQRNMLELRQQMRLLCEKASATTQNIPSPPVVIKTENS